MKNGHFTKRFEAAASVYLCAVIEYLVAEMLELSGNACRNDKRKRIQDKHIYRAVDMDKELKELIESNPSFQCVTSDDLAQYRPKPKLKKMKKKKGRWDDDDV